LGKVVREATFDKEGVELGENSIEILAYGDDIVFIAESKNKLKEQSKKLINAAKRIGLDINFEKTVYMVVQRYNQINHHNEYLEVEVQKRTTFQIPWRTYSTEERNRHGSKSEKTSWK